MAKKSSVTLPVETAKPADVALILSTLPAIYAAEAVEAGIAGKYAKAKEASRVAYQAMYDAVLATTGTLDTLKAHDKSSKPAELKSVYAAIKWAFARHHWGETFVAWLTDPAKPDPSLQHPTSRKIADRKDRTYWRQQIGSLFGAFLKRAEAAIEAGKAEAVGQEEGAKSPRQAKSAVVGCKDAVVAASKRMANAIAKGEEIPPTVNSSAFKTFCDFAALALEPGKTAQGRVETAIKAMRAAGILI